MAYNPEDQWGIVHAPADATQATIGKAAATNVTHYATGITVTVEGAIAVGAVTFNLRDSTTGAGNILWTGKITLGVAEAKSIVVTGLNVPGVAGQQLTLESAAAPAASQSATVALQGYSVYRVT